MRTGNFWIQTSVKSLIALTLLVGCSSNPPSTSRTPVGDGTVSEQATPQFLKQLDAIEAFIAQHQVEEARALINSLQFDQLSTEEQTRYVLAQADIALILGEGQVALEWLSGEQVFLFDGLPLQEQINISLKRAEAYEFAGRPLSAARERIFLGPVLSEEQALINHEQIWFDLQLVPQDQLKTLAERESSPDMNGWIELTLISQIQSGDLYRQLSSIENWVKRRRSHPAAVQLPASLQILREIASSQPTHIGVLLPLSGTLEKAGHAIRNGLLTAWYHAKQMNQNVPELSFYDTAEYEDVLNIYNQAVNNGAESIIGPLSKAKVQRLFEADTLPVPVLALNTIDTGAIAKENFFQFGLPPEDEATQVAIDIWQQGARHVMVIAPDSTWGHRVSDAFIKQWQFMGGAITSKALFGKPDQYLSSIQNALNIHNSQKRNALLTQRLSQDLEFEFRRRQDVDMVFMAAFPAQARQLKPLLNYQRAASIPVVATSHLYSGKNDASKDQDLEGLRFVEMPWRLTTPLIKQQASAAFPDSVAHYSTLVALGVDAYRLYARLPQMSIFEDVRVQGVTGNMSMNNRGRIVRELDWATITKGLVELLPVPELVLEVQ